MPQPPTKAKSAAKPASKPKQGPKPERTKYRISNRFVFKHPNGRYFVTIKGERKYVTWRQVQHGMGVMRRAKEREEKAIRNLAKEKAHRKKTQIERRLKREKREAAAKIRRAENRRLGYYY